MPPVSVVIPCYEQGHFLADAIRSVLGQDHPAHEIIVVSDGSTDETEAVASSFPEATYLAQRNSGVSVARNNGFRRSEGELLVFLDADDRLLPGALGAAARFLSARPDLAFTWGFNRPVDPEGRVVGEVSNPLTGPSTFERLLERNIVGPPAGVMFRRGPIEEEGGFSRGLPSVEDYDMYLRLARTRPFECHGELVADYRYHDAKMSGDMERMYQALMTMFDRCEPMTRHDRRLRAALRRGRRNAAAQFRAAPRWEALGDRARDRQWMQGAIEATGLAIRYPRTFFPRLWRRMRRAVRSGTG